MGNETPTNDAPVTVEQCDREAAALLIEGRSDLISSGQRDWCEIDQKMFREGAKDAHPFVQAFARHRLSALASAPAGDGVDMILHCPACGVQHIDEPSEGWDNPPHRSHLCLSCGHIWRPADVPTNGVVSIKTKGSADTTSAALARPRAAVGEREAYEALVRARDLAMRMTVEARIPECGSFGAIAQDLDAILALQSPPAKVEA